MRRLGLVAANLVIALALGFVFGVNAYAWGRRTPDCHGLSINPQASVPLAPPQAGMAGGCHVRWSNGYPLPDPSCTPGAINPTVTLSVLRNHHFRTGCIRNHLTTEREKAITYQWYSERHPWHNYAATQTCELDHLIPLELGGADSLANIWPQCGPANVGLYQRFFKIKDTVENYLAYMVKAGRMQLADAQRGIAANWPQYLSAAETTCPRGRCPYYGRQSSYHPYHRWNHYREYGYRGSYHHYRSWDSRDRYDYRYSN